jgi:hypothetical protein
VWANCLACHLWLLPLLLLQQCPVLRLRLQKVDQQQLLLVLLVLVRLLAVLLPSHFQYCLAEAQLLRP